MNGYGTGIASPEGEFFPDRSGEILTLARTGEVAWPGLLKLGTNYIEQPKLPPEACLSINMQKVRVPLLRSKVELFLFSLFLFFTVFFSIFMAFIIVAITEGYLIIDPYSMLFGVLAFLGLALTAWRGMKKRGMF